MENKPLTEREFFQSVFKACKQADSSVFSLVMITTVFPFFISSSIRIALSISSRCLAPSVSG